MTSYPIENTAHVADMLANLPEQFRNKDNITGLLTILGDRIQEAETMLQDVYEKRFIDIAVDAQLDVLGTLIGVARNGLSDDSYRVRIRLQLLTNLSSGLGDELIAVVALLTGNNTPDLTLTEQPPAAVLMQLNELVSADINELYRALNKVRAVSVELQLSFLYALAAHTFTFSSTSALEASSTLGFGDSSDATVGGTFAGVLGSDTLVRL